MVNIVIPCYNSQDTLPNALDSLVAQTQKKFIVTVVSDADGVDYQPIIEQYKKRGLKIGLLVLKENGGPGVARQRGMEAIPNCEYVMFLDSDDMYMPRAVERLSYEIQKNGLDLVASSFIVERNGKDIITDPSQIACTWVHGKIYRTKYLRDNKIEFPEMLRINEDGYFNFLAHNMTTKRAFIDEPLVIWRNNKFSITRQCSDVEFFKRGSSQLIDGQARGLARLYEFDKEIANKTCPEMLMSIYKADMTRKHFNLPKDSHYNSLKILKSMVPFQEFWKDEESWRRAVAIAPAGAIIGKEKEVIFFKERFNDWFYRNFIREGDSEYADLYNQWRAASR